MAQNIYDQADFYENYRLLPRSQLGLEGAAEWRSLESLLPEIDGKRIVDLGCGFGWFTRYAIHNGAKLVDAYDLSKNMLDEAIKNTAGSNARYYQANLESIALQTEHYDLAFSSLAFHYVEDFDRLVKTIYQSLVKGGDIVFSIEHPIYMAPDITTFVETHHKTIWPLNNYLLEGQRETNWLAEGVIKYHRTLGTTLNCLINNGFTLRHVEEWRPNAEQLKEHPEWQIELNRPMFLLISASKM